MSATPPPPAPPPTPPPGPLPPPFTPGVPPGPVAADRAPAATPGLATAALVCGIVGLVLFVLFVISVVALVLGLVAASQARRAPSPNSGLGRARAGWILGLVGVVAFAGFVVAAAADDGFGSDEVSVYELRPGDCVDRSEDTAEIADLPERECDEPHDAEVYLVEDLPLEGDEFPGEQRVSTEVEALCIGESFEDYVGIPYRRSIFEVYALSPSEESWDQGDRAAVCLVVAADGSPLTSSVEGSGV